MDIKNYIIMFFISIEMVLVFCALCFSILGLYKLYKSKVDESLIAMAIAGTVLFIVLIIFAVYTDNANYINNLC